MKCLLRVDEQGKVIIPDELREKLGYGTISIEVEDGSVILKKEASIESFIWTPNK